MTLSYQTSFGYGFADAFRRDAARWFEPGEIGDPNEASPLRVLWLLYRHVGLRVALAFRIGSALKERGIRGCSMFFERLIHRRYGLEIRMGAPIGGGLYIAHPVGTVLMPHGMGENCSVIANVTVGMRNEQDFPIIGDRVFLGAGARILGGIELGNDVRVGANAVVITSVDDGTVMVGIPARPLPHSSA